MVERWWHADRVAVLVEPALDSVAGVDADAVRRFAARADAVVTLAAHYRAEPWPLLGDVRPRILFEQDPGYTQLWAAAGDPVAIYGEHDLHFTVGALLGTADCSVPTAGIDWRPLWNPVVLDWWVTEELHVRDRGFTTVAAWRDYGYLEFEGRILGPKVEEFTKFLDLPARLPDEDFTLALAIDVDDPDRELLADRGWRLEDPRAVATPDLYRGFIQGSTGEFSCVKGGYAGTHVGWFSDRSACYLAAGRPVVLQATGFEAVLPTGVGLFAVDDLEGAACAIEKIRREPARHATAARRIAEEHFDARRVLHSMLRDAGVS
jgi:hypothetical protein